jgi:m7GpppX diphosphatase
MLSHTKLKLCHDDKKDIQYVVLVRDESLASIRDLRARHIPLLNDILRRCPPMLEEIYGIPVKKLRIFVQYHPQFYRFHVLLNHIENEVGCSTERGHLVSDIVQNLEMDGEYYCNRTLAYKIRSDDSLYHAMQMVEMVTLPLLEGT